MTTLSLPSGGLLDDGSRVQCCCVVRVAIAHSGWVPSRAVRNTISTVIEKCIGLEERTFVALERPDGRVYLLLLKNGEGALDITTLDADFHQYSTCKLPELANTMVAELVEDKVYRVTPSTGRLLPNGYCQHFDMTVDCGEARRWFRNVTKKRAATFDQVRPMDANEAWQSNRRAASELIGPSPQNMRRETRYATQKMGQLLD